MGFQVAYVPIGVGTFHLESAQIEFEKSIKNAFFHHGGGSVSRENASDHE